MVSAPVHPEFYTVSGLTRILKDLLETGFSDVTVEGELSGVKMAPSGHLYFTLKDEGAVLAGAFFKARERGLTFDPADGTLVRVTGRITVYEPRGQYQLTASSLVVAGQGALLARLEELKRRLAAEGLFNEDRKRDLPPYPGSAVLITSGSGAALQDMLKVFRMHRVPMKVRVLPVLVQGQDAPGQIARMIAYANRHGLGEVLVVGRGGGSLEDLAAFSAEEVVRAVAGSALPVISAVGHEIDFPLSDFAADLRAPTPTKAAEILCQNWSGLEDWLLETQEDLGHLIRQRLDQARLLTRPFQKEQMGLSWEKLLQPFRQRLDDGKEDLVDQMKDRLVESGQRLKLLRTEIEARSPQMLLNKGWSLVTDARGRVVTDSRQLNTGELLALRFAQGSAWAQVTEVNHVEKK